MEEPQTRELRDRLIGLVEQIVGKITVSPFPVDRQLSELGLSSLKMVNLMLAVELEFNIVIPQWDITPENFHSLVSIEKLIERLGTEPSAS